MQERRAGLLVRSVARAATVRAVSDASAHMGRDRAHSREPCAGGAIPEAFGASAGEWNDLDADGGVGSS